MRHTTRGATPARRPQGARRPQPVRRDATSELQGRAGNRAVTELYRLRQTATQPTQAPQPRVDRFAGDAHGTEPMLAFGARGDDVIHLQDYLVQAGGDLAVDGIFGPITKGAVRAFQRTASIADDGIVGPQTWSHLKAGGYSIGGSR